MPYLYFCIALGLLMSELYGHAPVCNTIAKDMKTKGHTVRDCTVHNGHVYWRVEEHLIWSDAELACRTVSNAHLISVHDFDEKSLVNNLCQRNKMIHDAFKNGCWIGLSRQNLKDDGQFIWSDGKPHGYSDFMGDEPLKGKNCIEVIAYSHNGAIGFGWVTADCSGDKLMPICKVAEKAS